MLTLFNTQNFALLPTITYLVYYYNAVFLPNVEIHTTSIKLLIRRYFTNFGMMDVGLPFCSGYCDGNLYNMESYEIIHQILKSQKIFHNSLFRTGNGRHAQAQNIGIPSYFGLVHKSYRGICSKIVGTAKSNQLSLYCDENILAVIQLATSHNMSVELLSPAEKIVQNPGTQFFIQYSVFTKGNQSVLTSLDLSNTIFSRDAYWSLIYCKPKFAEASYKLWMNGYPHELWIILAIPSIIAICKNFHSITFLAAIMLGQEISSFSRKMLFLMIFAFFARSLYENTITSDIIVPAEPQTYTSLREMMQDNVKILVRQSLLHNMPFDKVARTEFRESQIENMLNDSYEITRGDDSDDDITIQKMQRTEGTQSAYVAAEKRVKLLSNRISILLLNETGMCYPCFKLDQRFNPAFDLWLIHTLNRCWLAESLSRMRDSGLLSVWDNWRVSIYLLKSKLILRIVEAQFLERNFQVVQMSHLFSVVLLCLAIFYVGVFAFIMESCNSISYAR